MNREVQDGRPEAARLIAPRDTAGKRWLSALTASRSIKPFDTLTMTETKRVFHSQRANLRLLNYRLQRLELFS